MRFVRQYAATSSTRSSSGVLQGRPLRTGSGTQGIADQPQGRTTAPLLQRHIDDARQLVVVLQLCTETDVDLLFG
ncbi:hypothetical protein ACWEOA_08930 [Streptomyces sp. NPDC004457]